MVVKNPVARAFSAAGRAVIQRSTSSFVAPTG
jgi:hypothetical protein